jgi:hypothetical protein
MIICRWADSCRVRFVPLSVVVDCHQLENADFTILSLSRHANRGPYPPKSMNGQTNPSAALHLFRERYHDIHLGRAF